MSEITIQHDPSQPFGVLKTVRTILNRLGDIATQKDNITIVLEGITDTQVSAVFTMLSIAFVIATPNYIASLPYSSTHEPNQFSLNIREFGNIKFTRIDDTRSTISLPAYENGALPVHQMKHVIDFIDRTILNNHDAIVEIRNEGGYVPIAFPDVDQANVSMHLLSSLIAVHVPQNVKNPILSCMEGHTVSDGKPVVLVKESVMKTLQANELGKAREL